MATPVGEKPGQYNPESPILRPEPWSLGIPLQDLELMAEGDVLQGEGPVRAQRRQEQKREVFEHNRGYRPGTLSR